MKVKNKNENEMKICPIRGGLTSIICLVYNVSYEKLFAYFNKINKYVFNKLLEIFCLRFILLDAYCI